MNDEWWYRSNDRTWYKWGVGMIVQQKQETKKQEPSPQLTKSIHQHNHKNREWTYRTCRPRSSQTGFQSALPSPASTRLHTSTIMVVAVSISKQHWALFVSPCPCPYYLIPRLLHCDWGWEYRRGKGRLDQQAWNEIRGRRTHLNPSSRVINHCLLSVPSTQHPAMIAGQVRLSSAPISSLSQGLWDNDILDRHP